MLTKSNVGGFTLVPVLFVMTLFLMLSVMSVSVIIAGSGVYQKISDNMEKNYDRRVTLSYITTKIRQNDAGGNIYVEDKNGVKMLAIKENDGEDDYVTYIYYYDPTPSDRNNDDGYISEIFLGLDKDGKTIGFDLSDGEEIIKSQGFEFELLSDRIKMDITDENGNLQSTQIILRSHG